MFLANFKGEGVLVFKKQKIGGKKGYIWFRRRSVGWMDMRRR
jgi:hypothetical protein